MKTRLLSLLGGTALSASISVAQADEARVLGEKQMDQMTAGYTINVEGPETFALTVAAAGQKVAAGHDVLVNSGPATFDIRTGVFTFTPSSTDPSTTSTLFTVRP